MSELPFYIDDPLVDLNAHRLSLHTDETESNRRGYRATFGACSCGEWTTPSWDDNAVLGSYDDHMNQVQTAARRRTDEGS